MLANSHMPTKNAPRRTRLTFGRLLNMATTSRTGRTPFSYMSATSHATVAAHASLRISDVQNPESECKV